MIQSAALVQLAWLRERECEICRIVCCDGGGREYFWGLEGFPEMTRGSRTDGILAGRPLGLSTSFGAKKTCWQISYKMKGNVKKKKKSTPRALCLSLIHLLESAKNIHHTHTHTFPKTTDLNLTRLSGSSQYFLISGYIQILNLETKEPVCAHETAYVIAQHFPHFTQLCFCSAVLAA